MKIGLVGYQGSGKSTLFELLTGVKPDLSKSQSGQVGIADVPDERFDRLVEHYNPKKIVPTRIELFDTPGLTQDQESGNSQKLGTLRESTILIHVIGLFIGVDPVKEVQQFNDDLLLADLQVISNRIEKLTKDASKPRPDKDQLQAELEALQPIAELLNNGEPARDMEFSELQELATKSYSLLTRKRRLVVLNSADSDIDAQLVEDVEKMGDPVICAPVGLELELNALDEEERLIFAEEMGLKEESHKKLLRKIFEVTDQITFYTSDEKEVHAWLLNRGSTVVEAAHSIHSDLARGFVRAEIWSADDLLKCGSERELKAQGLNHVEGKDYIVQDGDEIFIRSGV
jgi:ribosome-binding ATPase